MAIGIWLEHGSSVDGVIAFSGGWLTCFQLQGRPTAPILMTHGIDDPLVPIAFGSYSHKKLVAVGAEASFHRYSMGHEINDECLNEASQWLNRCIPG